MPTKSEGARAEILAALRADASDGFVPLAAVASSGAEPSEAAGVTIAVAQHAILAADGGRSDGEAEWLAATVVHAALAEARAAGLAVDGDVPYEFFTRHLRGALVQAS